MINLYTCMLFIYNESFNLFIMILQRNHSLFGTVISALQGTRTSIANRSNSLTVNHQPPHQKLSPTNSLHNPSPNQPPLSVEQQNAINNSPHMAPSPISSPHQLSPVTSAEHSRRPSHNR